MKRTIIASLALSLGFATAAEAQSRYGYRNAPNGDREVVDHEEPYVRRPILNRIVGDLRVAKQEIDKGLFEMRDELRRAIHGGEPVYVDDYYGDRRYREEPGSNAGESFGRFSPETLERARRQQAEERARFQRRQDAIQRDLDRERELAERRRFDDRPNGIRLPKFRPEPKVEAEAAPPVIVRPRPNQKSTPAPEPKPEVTPPAPIEKPAPKTVPDPKPAPEDIPPLPTIREKTEETKLDSKPEAPRIFTEAEKRNFPLATTTDKPGFVRSPYPPFELLDVRGLKAGSLAREPEGERVFRVPK